MKIHVYGQTGELIEGIEELSEILHIELHADGMPVEAVQAPGPLQVTLRDGKGSIRYQEKIHFYRALGLFVQHAAESDSFEITEEPKFTFNGTMLDVSRGGVLTVPMVKRFIRYMALMGLNGLMMYTEDTFEVEGLPYFGYMRGRYTAEELRECDAYADMLGIEMIPCIQTLGHLAQALKWNYAAGMKDHQDILLVGEPQTYEFIERMIAAAAQTYRTKRIHIGMDEAFQVGLGNYLRKHGYHNRFELMNEHVAKVLEITERYGLKPMIWSDMYFNLLSNDTQGGLYNINADFSEDKMDQIPKGVQFVYWDYGKADEEGYGLMYEKHLKFGSKPIFAGGIHIWNNIVPNYGKTWNISNPALRAAKTKQLDEVLATAWADNGNENNHLTILPGLQLFAEHGYGRETDEESLRQRLRICTGLDLFKPVIALSRMDEVPGVLPENYWMANPSKYLLWQDLLIGLFDKHIEPDTEAVLPGYYEEMAQELGGYRDALEAPFDQLFSLYERLARVLALKGTLGVQLKRCYDEGRKDELRRLAEETLPELYRRADELRVAHRRMWMQTYKPFGWEVLDIRYGGLLARIRSAEDRVLDYAEGRVAKLEELEAERLLYDQTGVPEAGPLNVNATYQSIVTAGAFV